MSDWWEKPYEEGAPVPVAGFPRPLYPPDASEQGKKPSPHGADVEAYKRGLWRGGRWPGPASSFDRAYSDGFAHGKGGNVVETGVAGFQRQVGIDDSGWFGQPTFEKLRRALVPAGRPHEGEPLLDALALNLIAEAWQAFEGQTVRERAVAGAAKWIGTKESPSGSNATPFGVWYGVNYQPWCAIFASYCFEVEAGGSPSFAAGSRYAYVPYIVDDARNGRNGLSVTSAPIPGDLCCYDWERDGTFDHTGFFESGTPTSFRAVEGNTSTSSNSNGGEVMRRDRSTSQATIVFVRVREP